MFRKSIYLLSSIFVLSLVCTSSADIVIGDFEGSLDGWTGAWTGTGDLGNSAIGATLNSQSMSVKSGPGEFWKLQRDGQLNLVGATAIAADVTYIASEWPDPATWLNLHKICIQDHTTWAWQEVDLPAITVTKISGADVQAPDADGNRAWWKPELGDATWTVSWSLEGKTLSDDVYSLFMSLQNTNIAKNIAGLIYVDNVRVVREEPAPIGPVHSYTFEDGTANDSVGDADGTLVGDAYIDGGALITVDQDDWMEMPGDIIAMNTYDEVTIEAWYTPEAGGNTGWSMLASFGSRSPDALWRGVDYIFMTSARADDKSRAAISCLNYNDPWATEIGVDGPEYDDGLLHHMVMTLTATDLAFYIDGVSMGSTALGGNNIIANISTDLALLAKAVYNDDPEWIGQINEFNIYNRALSEADIAALFAAGL